MWLVPPKLFFSSLVTGQYLEVYVYIVHMYP